MRTLRLLRPDAWRSAPPSHGDAQFGGLHPWLTSRGSLTARIMRHFQDFNLVRLAQRAQLPNLDERRAVGLRDGELAIVREVLLRDGETPLVFAHSLVARRDLNGVWRGLSRLGGRPLAEMLFHDAAVARLPMEYRKIDARHPLYRRAKEVAPFQAASIWARRSVFLKRGRPLLVTEVFLAGGLIPGNARAAIDPARPLGPDICGGACTDGKPDPLKLRAFFTAAGK